LRKTGTIHVSSECEGCRKRCISQYKKAFDFGINYNNNAQPYTGRQYYTVTVRYQHQKELDIPYAYAAIVEIWNNQEEYGWVRYDPATAKSVTFGDGTHIDFIEKSLLERIKAKRQ
jgi:hypothetical protein